MKLIVGLGNPGLKYSKTRHNIGFMVIDEFAKENKISITKKKFNGLYAELDNSKEKAILLKPLSYMNLSGTVVKSYVDYFKIDIEDILVISDDLDQEFAKIKLKPFGTSGGHNGLKNIEQNIGTTNYKRLKIGIANDKSVDTKDYVLNKLSKKEQLILKDKFSITNNILNDFLLIDYDKVMNKYN